VAAPHRPDEAGPEQQHKGQPAVIGDAPHLGSQGQWAGAAQASGPAPQPTKVQGPSATAHTQPCTGG
jgi:hypothetical protein